MLRFIGFEIYFQFCTLCGYKPRHIFLEPTLSSGVVDRVLIIWPRLPIHIHALNWMYPTGGSAHAQWVTYSAQAEAAARAAGYEVAVKTIVGVPCELRVVVR
jgi:hypothetical protein